MSACFSLLNRFKTPFFERTVETRTYSLSNKKCLLKHTLGNNVLISVLCCGSIVDYDKLHTVLQLVCTELPCLHSKYDDEHNTC